MNLPLKHSELTPLLLAPCAGLVVCENAGRWVRVWRRECTKGVAIAETPTPADAWQQLEAWHHGALAIELRPQNAPQTIELLARVQLQLPHVLCVAHLSPALASWEMLLREAGAIEVVYSPRRLAGVARLVERHLARAPRPPQSIVERLRQQLPWPEINPAIPS